MSEVFKIVAKLLLNAWTGDNSMRENSIVGESRFDREARRILGIRVLTIILAVLAFAAWEEWG